MQGVNLRLANNAEEQDQNLKRINCWRGYNVHLNNWGLAQLPSYNSDVTCQDNLETTSMLLRRIQL